MGFLITWLGFAILIFPMVIRGVFNRKNWTDWSEPFAERVRVRQELLNYEINTVGKTKFGRLGGILIAIGSSILMFWFVIWLIDKIVSK